MRMRIVCAFLYAHFIIPVAAVPLCVSVRVPVCVFVDEQRELYNH